MFHDTYKQKSEYIMIYTYAVITCSILNSNGHPQLG